VLLLLLLLLLLVSLLGATLCCTNGFAAAPVSVRLLTYDVSGAVCSLRAGLLHPDGN
jgi:hypothetical protein